MSWMIVIGVLFVALVLYTLLGGADFGVGIVERMAAREDRTKLRELGEKAIAPVWEANHIWLVLVLVVLFVGFPSFHYTLMTLLYFPLLLMLVGILIRGTAFTFRHYETRLSQSASVELWTPVFQFGSLLVPVTFGIVVAALREGKLDPAAGDVFSRYMAPWLGIFPMMTGFFVTTLFGWIGAVFLSLEASTDKSLSMDRLVRHWTIAMLLSGLVTTLAAFFSGTEALLLSRESPWAFLAVGAATIGVILTLRWSTKGWVKRARFAVGWTVLWIHVGFWFPTFPCLGHFVDGACISARDTAPNATMDALALALVMAALVIFPALGYLYRIFKSTPSEITG